MRKTIFDPAYTAGEKADRAAIAERKRFFKHIRYDIKEDVDSSVRDGLKSAAFYVPKKYKDEFDATVMCELLDLGYKLTHEVSVMHEDKLFYRINWQ